MYDVGLHFELDLVMAITQLQQKVQDVTIEISIHQQME
jgi:hypothetical protein